MTHSQGVADQGEKGNDDLLIAVTVPLLIPAYRAVFDRESEYEQGVLTSVRLHQNTAAASLGMYCLMEKWSLVERLADVPEVRASLRGSQAHMAVFNIVRVAHEKPPALARCLGAFKRAGWDPNQATHIPTGITYRDAIQNGVAPKGYLAYLEAHQGLVHEGEKLKPENLLPTALLHAVWHEDVGLITALVNAGADPKLKSKVTVFGVKRRWDVPLIDAVEAASLTRNPQVVAAVH